MAGFDPGRPTLYFDNNATTRPSPGVLAAMLPWLGERWGNPSSLHRLGQEAQAAVAQSREQVARLLGAQSREIVFTGSATESNHAAIQGLIEARRPRRRLVTTRAEHSAVLEPLRRLARSGWELIEIGLDRRGGLDLEAYLGALDQDVALATAMWVNNETGVIFDVPRISERCRELGIPFHVDAVQAVGKLDIDLARVPCTSLSLSAHKFHGPKGVGALFVREGAAFEPLFVGGGQEDERRAGTENVAAIVGLGVAAEESRAWLRGAGRARTTELRARLEDRLASELSDIEILGAACARVAHTTQVLARGISGEALVVLCDDGGLCASSGSACSAGQHAPSHVLLAMGLSSAEASSALRLSLARDTSTADVDQAAGILIEAVRALRSFLTPSVRPA